MDKRSEMLANERIGSLLLKLSLPAAIGMIVQASYNVVDAIFVGRGVGPMGIAGITIDFPIQMVVMAVAQMIGIGAASIVSRSLGAQNKERAEKALGNSFTLSLGIGLLITVLGLLFIDPLLKVFGSTETILPYAKTYLNVILFGTFFTTFGMASNNVVRAEGNAKIAMWTMLIGALMNIGLDPLFIFGFHMGIKGAAIATVISQFATFIWLLIYYLSGKSVMKFRVRNLKLDRSVTKETFSIGVSSFVRQISASIIIAILNNTLGFYGGDMAITIYGLVNRLSSFALMPSFGVAQGFQPIAGFSYGAKRFDRTRRSMYLATIAATVVTTVGFLVMELFPRQLIGMFTTDQSLISSTVSPLRIVVMIYPMVGFMAIVSTMFQAIGKALQAFVLSMARQIIFLIPLVLVLPKFFKLPGVWYSFPIADFLTMFLSALYLIPEIKKLDKKILEIHKQPVETVPVSEEENIL
jgi:putative MATE family efflux protein